MGIRSISVGIAALVTGYALESVVTQAGAVIAARRAEAPSVSVFGTIHPDIFRLRSPIGTEVPVMAQSEPGAGQVRGLQLASLDPDAGAEILADAPDPREDRLERSATPRASFDERFSLFDDRISSFAERFGPLPTLPPALDHTASIPPSRAVRADISIGIPLPPRRPATEQAARAPVRTASLAPDTPDLRPSATEKVLRPAPEARPESPAAPNEENRTAIYDISAGMVYMPDGSRLEAHSGLGEHLDDPRAIKIKMRGPTPPNVYKLSMREKLFHGVRAVRLTPVDGRKMYGRAGMLAHTYMLGPNGQSNGCVSFKNYDAFLRAFERGQVTRMVVVERLDTPPGPRVASSWLPSALRNLFGGNNGPDRYAAAAQ
ncbi:DUF2778 domain-containing protein [Rhodovulum sp. PH10]|uniref:DUF2778 domain-containing protein n=1 Tax=Rhodovulum sp. PH10 TaxID=1187851 RepID=UPI00069183C8|nr:DUF2778 domain-containing protein [Rhodovulum sp. PH10]